MIVVTLGSCRLMGACYSSTSTLWLLNYRPDWKVRHQTISHVEYIHAGALKTYREIFSKCQMSKWIKTAQFHAKHLDCARCTSISRTRSSSMYAERHRCLQSVHAVRQRRPADRVCYVDTAERSSGAGWLIVDVDRRRRRLECSSWPWNFVLQTPTDHDSYNTWTILIIKNLYMIC